MHRFFSSIRYGPRSSLISLFAPKPSPPFNAALRPCRLPPNDVFVRCLIQSFETAGHVRRFSSGNFDWRRLNLSQNVNADVNTRPDFMQNRENINSRSWNNLGQNVNAGTDAQPDFMQDKENINFRTKDDAETGLSSRPMDFVRGIIDEDNFMRGAASQYHYEQDADIVHIKMLRNNTFVTVTDSKGNVKLNGSAGSLKDLKSGQKLSRYAAEATAEVVGRRARGLGLKSVVMKVNGFTHFRRKRQAILSWREGYSADSRGDRNPIVYIEDTTRKPHNGCRLPKKRQSKSFTSWTLPLGKFSDHHRIHHLLFTLPDIWIYAHSLTFTNTMRLGLPSPTTPKPFNRVIPYSIQKGFVFLS
ncbi:putative ribosomal protein S11, mitochondrial, partial [Mucuna pruriens]